MSNTTTEQLKEKHEAAGAEMVRITKESPPHSMPAEYYLALRTFNETRNLLNKETPKGLAKSGTLGECAEYKREITTTTYLRAQARMKRNVASFLIRS